MIVALKENDHFREFRRERNLSQPPGSTCLESAASINFLKHFTSYRSGILFLSEFTGNFLGRNNERLIISGCIGVVFNVLACTEMVTGIVLINHLNGKKLQPG